MWPSDILLLIPVLLLTILLIFITFANHVYKNFLLKLTNSKHSMATILGIIIVVLVLSVLLGTPICLYLFMKANSDFFLKILSCNWSIPLIFIFGWMLYRFREMEALFYGILEVSASLAVIIFTIHAASADLDRTLIGLLGALYIMVRGLDNMRKGLDNDHDRPTLELWDRFIGGKKRN